MEHLRDLRANDALDLFVALVPQCLGLQFGHCRGASNCFHWADTIACYQAPKSLGLKVVPHLLLPEAEVRTHEDRDKGSKVVVVGGYL